MDNNGWISVDEALPCSFGDVLIYFDGIMCVGLYHPDNETWTDDDLNKHYDVTHWQHLPGRPEGKQ